MMKRTTVVLKYHHTYYGKGDPGWNATVYAFDAYGSRVGSASWPNVHQPTADGVLYGRVRQLKKLVQRKNLRNGDSIIVDIAMR